MGEAFGAAFIWKTRRRQVEETDLGALLAVHRGLWSCRYPLTHFIQLESSKAKVTSIFYRGNYTSSSQVTGIFSEKMRLCLAMDILCHFHVPRAVEILTFRQSGS